VEAAEEEPDDIGACKEKPSKLPRPYGRSITKENKKYPNEINSMG
jgi:hypothetical protein